MAFDPGGFPAISYSDYLAGTKLIRKNATGWGGATTIDSGTGPLSEIGSTALAFDPSGRAGIAYNIRGLLAYAQEGAGGVWSKGAVRNVSAQSISLVRSAMDGTARISYYDPIAHVLRYDGPDPSPPGGGDPGCNPCDPCDPCPILRVAANVTPNPVRLGGAFVIALSSSRGGHVSGELYDVAGRRVAEMDFGGLTAGRHELRWSPQLPGAGLYLIRLRHDGVVVMKQRMIAIR